MLRKKRNSMKMPTVFMRSFNAGPSDAVPHPMVTISGKPFLEWKLLWLAGQNFTDIVLMEGYGCESIRECFGEGYRQNVSIRYSDEALPPPEKAGPGEPCVILDGNVLFDVPLAWLVGFMRSAMPGGSVCMALKYKENTSGYRSFSLESSWRITDFSSSKEQDEGYVEGGVVVAAPGVLHRSDAGSAFLDKGLLKKLISEERLFGVPFGGRLVDAGCLGDSRLADFPIGEFCFQEKRKALFLDRDGILIEDTGYVKDPDALIFKEEFFELSKKAQDTGFVIIIVSNQAGVAKGRLGIEDVLKVNDRIKRKLESYGVRPAGIYWCPFHENGTLPKWTRKSLQRKPEPGMVLKAVEEHGIDPLKSIMVGDRNTDRIKLPYLRSLIIPGRYPVDDRGDLTDIAGLENAIRNF